MPKTNNERLQEIAEAMQDLNERLVYVGGAMTGLYANDPSATDPRTTTDVDCVVNSSTYGEHAVLKKCFAPGVFKTTKRPTPHYADGYSMAK